MALAHLAAVLRRRHDISEVDEPDWDAQVDINLKATFFLNRAFAERLRFAGRPGAIVNFSSQGWWTEASAARSSTTRPRAGSSR